MYLPEKNSGYTVATVYEYLPAVLKENKSGWIIEYYVVNPFTQKLSRKQIRLKRLVNRCKSRTEARAYARKTVESVNKKLSGGWNPFLTGEDARLFTKLADAAKLFIEEKEKEARQSTMRSYKSFVNLFTNWINDNYLGQVFTSEFSHAHAARYMDYIYIDRKVNQTTYNNHIKMARAFFNWMLDKCYTKQNPFNQVKTKKKEKKTRVIIPKTIRLQINNYLEENNPEFLIVCKLVYNALLRPNEIRQIRISDIDLKNKYISVKQSVAKTHKARFAALNDDLINSFLKLNIWNLPGNYFVFGKYFKPARLAAGSGYYNKAWAKMRKVLKFPEEMQLYSLRDTGIFDMLKSGIDDLSVMQHADHSSLDITTKYADHHDPNLIKIISERSPNFS